VTSVADRAEVVGAFDTALYPRGGSVTLETAWMGIYQTLWWYHQVEYEDGTLGPKVLHVREANDLAKPLWHKRAGDLEASIASGMGIRSDELEAHVDRMMLLPRWRSKQRNNPLGHGLRIILSELLQRFGSPAFNYPEEELAKMWFPGIEMPGRSENPKIDVAAVRKSNGRPQAMVSCKWSIRHDRVSDPTNECTAYKAAAVQQNVMDLRYFVVTNEMNVKRLDKILNQPCVDGLVHVHLPAVEVMEKRSALMDEAAAKGRLFDLVDFVKSTAAWS
jgi:hypothetical protein